ncbi:hypothetical protein BIU90_02975 [Curtobacterium sp. MCBA15_001]|nr:hypothetical protein BIU90_02975 [Curtobacterium sp. MCBA15_001]
MGLNLVDQDDRIEFARLRNDARMKRRLGENFKHDRKHGLIAVTEVLYCDLGLIIVSIPQAKALLLQELCVGRHATVSSEFNSIHEWKHVLSRTLQLVGDDVPDHSSKITALIL